MAVDRRSVLGMLAVSGVLLSSFMRKALGQPASDALVALPGASGEHAQSLGLPSDWRFVAPARWGTVDDTLAARLNPALRDNSPIELGGIRVMRSSGKIELGQLDPVGQSVDVPPALADVIAPADEALSVEALNHDFNPFLSDPRAA